MHPDKAVIFDVDGVLVDSFDAHLRSWLATAHAEGLPFTEQDFIATFGRTSREIAQTTWGISDEARIRAIDDHKEALYRELVATKFPAMDGATELIASLRRAGFALAMGSSGPPENLELALDQLGCRPAFAVVISGRDVTRGKPDPEVFTLAAERLHVSPARCVVVEDAPAGVQAATAAHMSCVALLSKGRKREDFAELSPNLIVTSLRELSPQRFESLIQV